MLQYLSTLLTTGIFNSDKEKSLLFPGDFCSKIKLSARKSQLTLRLELRSRPDPLWENKKLAATFFLMRLVLVLKLNNCVGGSQD